MEKQKTIKKEFSLEGKGLQTGRPVRAFFYPEPEESGIVFARKDIKGTPGAKLGSSLKSYADKRRSGIELAGGAHIETVEHVTAALWGAGIDNIRIELDSPETPCMDGGALRFLEELERSGIKEGASPRKYVTIREPVWVEEGDSFVGVFPDRDFRIFCLFEPKNSSLRRQVFSKEITYEVFRKEIAPARTIWIVPGGERFLKIKAFIVRFLGYGRGVSEKTVLAVGRKGILNKEVIAGEPVRHKVLDLIGDLYLLGRPLRARVIAIRPGHRLNLMLVDKIRRVAYEG